MQAGPSKAMNWYNIPGNSTVPAGPRGNDTDAMNGNAVMFDAVAGHIFTAGGQLIYSGGVRDPNLNLKVNPFPHPTPIDNRNPHPGPSYPTTSSSCAAPARTLSTLAAVILSASVTVA